MVKPSDEPEPPRLSEEGLGHRTVVPLSIAFGAVFGLIAPVLIETMRALEKALRRFERHPYLVAAGGGLALLAFYLATGDEYAGLGTPVIEASLRGHREARRPGLSLD